MKTAETFGKRSLAVLLALMMCVSLLNLTVFAADETDGKGKVVNVTKNATYDTLEEAVKNAENGDTIHVYPGNYNIRQDNENAVEGQTGWYLPITKSISLIGVDKNGNPINDSTQTQANIYSTDYSPNGAWATQNLITVFADDVTIFGPTIMNKIDENKALEVVSAKDVTISNCKFAPFTEELIADADPQPSAGPNYGTALYFNGENGEVGVTVEGCYFDRSRISLYKTTEGTVSIEGNTFTGKAVWGSPTVVYNAIGLGEKVDIDAMEIEISRNKFIDSGKVGFSKNDGNKSVDVSGNYWGNADLNDVLGEKVAIRNKYTDAEMQDLVEVVRDENGAVGVPVAQIGSEKFISLQAAINAANDGDTITLLDDITLTETLVIESGVNFTLTGASINRGTGFTGALIQVKGTLTLEDITVDGGSETGETAVKAMILVDASGTLQMNEGAVLQNNNNTSVSGVAFGGAVYVAVDGSFAMNGGTIQKNSAWYAGGVDNDGTFTMTGGCITGNTATGGPAGGIRNRGEFTAQNAEISWNQVIANGGGGVWSTTSVTMTDCIIANNTAAGGGGIFVQKAANASAETTVELTLNNCTVNYNTTTDKYGGGVWCDSLFTMNGGEIVGNSSTTQGGGVYGRAILLSMAELQRIHQMPAVVYTISRAEINRAETVPFRAALLLKTTLQAAAAAVYAPGTMKDSPLRKALSLKIIQLPRTAAVCTPMAPSP